MTNKIISTFKYYRGGTGHGAGNLDIIAKCGTPLIAQFDGIATARPGKTDGVCNNLGKIGRNGRCMNSITVQYGQGLTVQYLHLLNGQLSGRIIDQCKNRFAPKGSHTDVTLYKHGTSLIQNIKKYAMNVPAYYSPFYVKAGQVLGYIDSTGNSTGSHLHMSLKLDNEGVVKTALNFDWNESSIVKRRNNNKFKERLKNCKGSKLCPKK